MIEAFRPATDRDCRQRWSVFLDAVEAAQNYGFGFWFAPVHATTVTFVDLPSGAFSLMMCAHSPGSGDHCHVGACPLTQ
jgi:hypothetical protein